MTSSQPLSMLSTSTAAPSAPALTWADHAGCPIALPCLTATCIEAPERLYAYRDPQTVDRLFVRDSLYYFPDAGQRVLALDRLPRDPDGKVLKPAPGHGWHKYPATVRNLQAFCLLPFVLQEERDRALELICHWGYVVPAVCRRALSLKASTVATSYVAHHGEQVTGHRLPVDLVSRQVVRVLTADETLVAALTGQAPAEYLLQTRTTEVLDSIPFAECEWYKQFSPKQLYSQQLIAAWAICQARRLPLWYDMRVGKTDAALTAAKAALACGEVDRVVVVCPRTNLYAPWLPEAQAYGFRTEVLDQSRSEDEAVLDLPSSEVNCIIVGYERLARRLAYWQAAWGRAGLERTFVILDETSYIKNHMSGRAAACHSFCEVPRYVTCLNGTPIEQGPHDLWSQYRTMDPYGFVWGWTYNSYSYNWLCDNSQRATVRRDRRADFDGVLCNYSLRYVRSESDQFAGKDKAFRYVQLPPTAVQRKQMVEALNGYVRDREDGIHEIPTVILSLYMHLREICAGYNKYRPAKGLPYRHERQDFDPKILWVHCYLTSQPGQPMVVYCEYTEQEQRLKELLNELGIPWASTRPLAQRQRIYTLGETVPVDVWRRLGEALVVEQATDALKLWESVFYRPDDVQVPVPTYLQAHPATIGWVERELYHLQRGFLTAIPSWVLEQWVYPEVAPYPPQRRAEELDLFNAGDRQVFVCKTSQARGIRLNRQEAVEARRGTWPVMVFLTPCWSLGTWDQAQDRAVAVDPATGRNVCTLIYALATGGSIEQRVLKALRKKKDVQSELLADAARDGYTSFVKSLIEDLTSAAMQADEFFDAEEMLARITCGVNPAAKLSTKRVWRDAAALAKRAQRDLQESYAAWLAAGAAEDHRDAALFAAIQLLLARVDEEVE